MTDLLDRARAIASTGPNIAYISRTSSEEARNVIRGLLSILDGVKDQILTGKPKPGDELLAMLERRMGSMKLVGERDDLLLDSAIFIAAHLGEK